MSFELPLFPLDVVLFPGMPLPLHIFEPRYRLMIGRCLESATDFGVAMLIEGTAGQSGTVPTSVGCSARILDVSPFADGRMNVQNVGERRFEILSTREEDDYLIGTCQWLEDETEDDIQSDALRLRRNLSRYFDALSLNSELPLELGELEIPIDFYELSMFVAAILTLPNDQKQTLLEMTSTKNRLELEDFLLERATIVHLAFAKRVAQGEATTMNDSSMGPMSDFVSLN